MWGVWFGWLIIYSGSSAAGADQTRALTSGWSPYPPYAFTESVKGIHHWKGLVIAYGAPRCLVTVEAPEQC